MTNCNKVESDKQNFLLSSNVNFLLSAQFLNQLYDKVTLQKLDQQCPISYLTHLFQIRLNFKRIKNISILTLFIDESKISPEFSESVALVVGGWQKRVELFSPGLENNLRL